MTFKRTPGTAADGSYLYVTIPEDEPLSMPVPTTEQLLQRRRASRLRERHQQFVQERSVRRASYLAGTIVIITLILVGVLHPWHKQDSHQHHRFMRIREFRHNIGGHFRQNHVHDMNSDRQMDKSSPSAPESHEYAASEDDKAELLNKDQQTTQDAASKAGEENDTGRYLDKAMEEFSSGLDGEVRLGDGNSDGTAFLIKEKDLTDKGQEDASSTP